MAIKMRFGAKQVLPLGTLCFLIFAFYSSSKDLQAAFGNLSIFSQFIGAVMIVYYLAHVFVSSTTILVLLGTVAWIFYSSKSARHGTYAQETGIGAVVCITMLVICCLQTTKIARRKFVRQGLHQPSNPPERAASTPAFAAQTESQLPKPSLAIRSKSLPPHKAQHANAPYSSSAIANPRRPSQSPFQNMRLPVKVAYIAPNMEFPPHGPRSAAAVLAEDAFEKQKRLSSRELSVHFVGRSRSDQNLSTHSSRTGEAPSHGSKRVQSSSVLEAFNKDPYDWKQWTAASKKRESIVAAAKRQLDQKLSDEAETEAFNMHTKLIFEDYEDDNQVHEPYSLYFEE